MRAYHYPAAQVVAEQLFQRLFPDQYRFRSLLIKRSWRIKSDGSLHSKRACRLYSVFKEQSACQPMKIYCFQQTFIGWQTLVNRDRKEGIFKSCPYYFFISYLISISKFFTICMIASRIRPFSSISTAI